MKWRLNDNHQDALVPRDACDLYEICGIVRLARADCFIRCARFEFLPSRWNVCVRNRLPGGAGSEANDAEEITVVVGPKRHVVIVGERSAHRSDEGIMETRGVG